MSGSSQPDHARDLQALHQWIKRNTIEAHDVTTGAIQPGGEFIPVGAVEEYLSDGGTYDRTKNILNHVFAGKSPNIARVVGEKCPRILCILVELGRAKLIPEFARYPNLHDKRLPFDSPRVAPTNFPVSTKEPKLYEAFYKTQWKYFAPELFPEIQAELLDQYVLPFERLEIKGKGNDAWVYRATVHEKHDKLTDPVPAGHCYALKTFKTQGSGSDTRYAREVSAFEQVTDSGNRDMVGLIACHSSFKYRDTFNIMLEYADYGNLQDFFDAYSSPTSGEMMINFWESLFDTAKAMYSIHEHFLGTDSKGNRTDIQGWHHDLKPANILVTTSDGRLNYPYSFKIADLGLSRFKHVMEGQPEASVQAAFGTRTYGAPECYASSEHTMHARNDVKRSADVWSLGCIYSEAAVWAVKGPKQLSNYKRERGLANSYLKTVFRDGACFHDGQRVLKAVGIQHDDLRRHFMERDFITGKVIDNMISEMLDHLATRRPSADQLVGKAEKQISLARSEHSRFALHTPPSNGQRPYPTPSQSPESATSDAPAVFDNRISGGSTYTNHHTLLNEVGRLFQSPEQSRANTAYPYPNGLDIGGVLPSIADLQEVGQGSGHGLHSQTLPILGGPSTHSPQRPPPPRAPPLITPGNHAIKPSEAVKGEAQANSVAQTRKQPKSELPECTRDQARAYYNARKDKKLSAALPHPDLLDYLRNRDYVFMVDDSESMKPYSNDAVELIKHMAYITKDMDQNKKLELAYLSKSPGGDFKSSRDLANHVHGHIKRGRTSLNQTFDEYLRNYRKSIERSKRKWSPFPEVKKCSVYVFTTGILDGGNDEQGQDAIKIVVDELVAHKLPLDQIGIQFISFGNNKEGLQRLQGLDHLKYTLKLGRDIIDTEPADGNFWKMLLGAINPKFDDDAPAPAKVVPGAIGWTPE